MTIFSKSQFLRIPINYRADIHPSIVDNPTLEENIRSKYIEKSTKFQTHVLNTLFDNAIFTLDLCFIVATEGESISWEASSPTLMAVDFETQAKNILSQKLQIYPRGTTSVSGKRSKIGIITFYAMIAKSFTDIDCKKDVNLDLVLYVRGDKVKGKIVQKRELMTYFSSHYQWVDQTSLERQIDLFLYALRDGIKYQGLELESLLCFEQSFFINKNGTDAGYKKYIFYRDGIADAMPESERTLFKKIYDIQMVAFYRNCMGYEVEPTQLMPVLHGLQNVGKTHSVSAPFVWLMKELKNNDMYYLGNIKNIAQEQGRHEIFLSRCCIFDDLTSSQSKKVVGELKELLSSIMFSKIEKYKDTKISYDARCVFWGTTNIQGWLPDVQNRRFPTFHVQEDIRHALDFDFSLYWDGVKAWALSCEGQSIAEMREPLIEEIMAMHKGNSELIVDEVSIVLEGISGDNLNDTNIGDRVIIPRKTLYSIGGKMQNSKHQIKDYIDSNNIEKKYKVRGMTIRGIAVCLHKESELLQMILNKRMPAVFVEDESRYTTAQYAERLRHDATTKEPSLSGNAVQFKVYGGRNG